jgi:hypothetical protein
VEGWPTLPPLNSLVALLAWVVTGDDSSYLISAIFQFKVQKCFEVDLFSVDSDAQGAEPFFKEEAPSIEGGGLFCVSLNENYAPPAEDWSLDLLRRKSRLRPLGSPLDVPAFPGRAKCPAMAG